MMSPFSNKRCISQLEGEKDLYNYSYLHIPLQQRYYKNNSSERNVELVKCLQKCLNISYMCH